MLCGVLFHDSIGEIAFLSPYIIFIMLLITYCRVSVNEFKVTKFIWALLAVQVLGALCVYFALLPFSGELWIFALIFGDKLVPVLFFGL